MGPESKEITRPMFYFCTYFDIHYLIKGMALYRSLVRQAIPFRLWVLCFDEPTYEILRYLELPEIVPISLAEFEKGDAELLKVKTNRSRVEYYFTSTPSLPLYVLNHNADIDVISYLDADLFFFSHPAPIYEELGDQSILIVGHRFPAHLRQREELNGIYNVCLLSFRKNSIGLQCLEWWRERCLEWCYDRPEDGRFADQKYLDDWPVRFQEVVVLQHKGAGLAPWNATNYTLSLTNDQMLVDSQPLVFYHFHGLRQIYRWLYDPQLTAYGARADHLLKYHIYHAYIRELAEVDRWLHGLEGELPLPRDMLRCHVPGEGAKFGFFSATAKNILHPLAIVKGVLTGDMWITVGGKIY
jgi:hypothetical protein